MGVKQGRQKLSIKQGWREYNDRRGVESLCPRDVKRISGFLHVSLGEGGDEPCTRKGTGEKLALVDCWVEDTQDKKWLCGSRGLVIENLTPNRNDTV